MLAVAAGTEVTQLDRHLAAKFMEHGWIWRHNWRTHVRLDSAEAFCQMVRHVLCYRGDRLWGGIDAGGTGDTRKHTCHPDCCKWLCCAVRGVPKSPCPPRSSSCACQVSHFPPPISSCQVSLPSLPHLANLAKGRRCCAACTSETAKGTSWHPHPECGFKP